MKQSVLVLLLLIPIGPAFAHSPGISTVEIAIGSGETTAEIEIARGSVDVLADTLERRDAPHSDTHLRSRFERVALAMIDLRVDGRQVPVENVIATTGDDDGVRFVLRFSVERGRILEVDSPMIESLGLGHRQLVSITTQHGFAHSALLSADKPTVTIDWPSAEKERGRFFGFLVEGVRHIWVGFDHILFLVALLLPAVLTRVDGHWAAVVALRPVLVNVTSMVTAFTLAHSVTLSLAALGWVAPPPRWVEPAIAATVVVAALNNLYPLVQGRRWLIAFGLGLVHGFGFAGALTEIRLPAGALVPALAGFNIGVELGQLAIVMLLVPSAYMLRATWLYQRVLVVGGSTVAALIALLWLIERTLDRDLTAIV